MVYNLGGVEYKTKASVIKRVREILQNTKANTKLANDNEAFVRDLLRLHPRHGSSQAVERDLYVVYSQRSSRDKCFAYWSERKQGVIDFSYKECLSPQKPIVRFREACRDAVVAEIISFKQEYWSRHKRAICKHTGQVITRSTSHVDHADICFAALVDQFINTHMIDLADVTYRGNGFAKSALAEAFVYFHRKHATLEIISAEANLRKNSGGYRHQQTA